MPRIPAAMRIQRRLRRVATASESEESPASGLVPVRCGSGMPLAGGSCVFSGPIPASLLDLRGMREVERAAAGRLLERLVSSGSAFIARSNLLASYLPASSSISGPTSIGKVALDGNRVRYTAVVGS